MLATRNSWNRCSPNYSILSNQSDNKTSPSDLSYKVAPSTSSNPNQSRNSISSSYSISPQHSQKHFCEPSSGPIYSYWSQQRQNQDHRPDHDISHSKARIFWRRQLCRVRNQIGRAGGCDPSKRLKSKSSKGKVFPDTHHSKSIWASSYRVHRQSFSHLGQSQGCPGGNHSQSGRIWACNQPSDSRVWGQSIELWLSTGPWIGRDPNQSRSRDGYAQIDREKKGSRKKGYLGGVIGGGNEVRRWTEKPHLGDRNETKKEWSEMDRESRTGMDWIRTGVSVCLERERCKERGEISSTVGEWLSEEETKVLLLRLEDRLGKIFHCLHSAGWSKTGPFGFPFFFSHHNVKKKCLVPTFHEARNPPTKVIGTRLY